MEASVDIDPQHFSATVRPLLEARDLTGLMAALRGRWTSSQIASLLSSSDPDVRKMACLGLSLVGCRKCLSDLVGLLKDEDPVMHEMAEHALWSIWFRLGTPEANAELHWGVKAINAQDTREAIARFSRAIEFSPDFAEAYNQRSTAYYLLEDYDRSIADARAALQRNPSHFGAWAGLGHCMVSKGCSREAIDAYQRALAIHPHLGCLAEALAELKKHEHADNQGGSI